MNELIGGMTVEQTLSAGLGAVSLAVTTLFALVVSGHKRVMVKLDECERDRKELWRELNKLTG